MTPKVYNRRHKDVPKDAIYVGRPTKWGNHFSHVPSGLWINKVATREDAVREYRLWLEDLMINDPNRYHQLIAPLRGKNLVCWCAPLPCHADILLKHANDI